MSNKKHALASRLDFKIVEYVDEVESDFNKKRVVSKRDRDAEIAGLRSELEIMRNRITELEAVSQSTSLGDKYALTKSKLVRFMKDQGYYE